jgi:hypothetical protein
MVIADACGENKNAGVRAGVFAVFGRPCGS